MVLNLPVAGMLNITLRNEGAAIRKVNNTSKITDPAQLSTDKKGIRGRLFCLSQQNILPQFIKTTFSQRKI